MTCYVLKAGEFYLKTAWPDASWTREVHKVQMFETPEAAKKVQDGCPSSTPARIIALDITERGVTT